MQFLPSIDHGGRCNPTATIEALLPGMKQHTTIIRHARQQVSIVKTRKSIIININ